MASFGERNVLRFDLNESREGFGEEGNGHILAEDRKGAGTNSGKSGTSNLEAESTRRRSLEDNHTDKTEHARNTCIAKSIYPVTNPLWDWESVGKLKQRRDAISFTCFQ